METNMADPLRQTGRSHKQILDALDRLCTTSTKTLYYIVPDGQFLPYYFDMAFLMMRGKQKADPKFVFRTSHEPLKIFFHLTPESALKVLRFEYKKYAMANGLHPDEVIYDHSFTD
jgi:hypothetical protein